MSVPFRHGGRTGPKCHLLVGKAAKEARRDVEHGLRITLHHYTTWEAQQRMLEILQFKLDVLWSMLDAMTMAFELERPPYHTVTADRAWHRGIAL